MRTARRKLVTANLARQGIVPIDCVYNDSRHTRLRCNAFEHRYPLDIPVFHSIPLPTPISSEFSFILRNFTSMVEVHIRDGIEWRMHRVLFSQPYAPRNRIHSNSNRLTERVRTNLGLDMRVFEDQAWDHPCTPLCVFIPSNPISFSTFRRTFRYWIIINLDFEYMRKNRASGNRYRLRNNLLPNAFLHDKDSMEYYNFWSIIDCVDPKRISLDSRQSTENAWKIVHPHTAYSESILYATFKVLWSKYCFNVSTTPILFSIIFMAKLKVRVSDRRLKDYAPGGQGYFKAHANFASNVCADRHALTPNSNPPLR